MGSFSCIFFLRQLHLNFYLHYFINIALKYLHFWSRIFRLARTCDIGIKTIGAKWLKKLMSWCQKDTLKSCTSVFPCTNQSRGISCRVCKNLAFLHVVLIDTFFFFRFWFRFNGPSRLFHSFWAESIARWCENGRSPRKTTWPPTSRTWLVSQVTQARLKPTAVRWQAI